MSFLELLALSYTLQFSYIPSQAIAVNDTMSCTAYHSIATHVAAGVVCANRVEIGGYAITESHPIHLLKMVPFQAEYEAHVSVRTGPLIMGFRHVCSHPVHSNNDDGFERNGIERWQSGKNELFVRLEGITKLKR
jgi:hypothetical protein